ncbi:MAG: RidA family protein [Bdellovibrionaceae bacterium]|nr:RidA family protein [Pseudobdellovibrionaceae bacterium]
MKKIVVSENAPAPIGPYSQAVQAGPFLFCSGQVALDPKSGQVVSPDVKGQTEQVMKNIEAVLTAGGLKFENVVKTTIFLTSMGDFPIVNEIYGRFFPTNPPARSTVEVRGLPKNVQVEIEVLAYKA